MAKAQVVLKTAGIDVLTDKWGMVLGVHSSRMLGARNNKHAQMDSACVVLYECDERDLDGRRISRER